MSSSSSRPIWLPSLERGTVVILSTIRLLALGRPVTEAVASKRSSWMMTTGRGFPTWSLPAAADQISPRLTRRRG